MEQDEQTKVETASPFFSINPREGPRGLVGFLLLVLLVLGVAAGAFVVNGNRQDRLANKQEEKQKLESSFSPLSKHTFVYGFWQKESSRINALDLNSGNLQEIAVLPSNIKKVTVFSPQRLIFINQTDIKDHGKEISSYEIASKLIVPVISASPGFGVDDYVISANKRFLALWEVSSPKNSQTLAGEVSRVYSVDLQAPGTKYLIYEEVASLGVVLHYPVAVTDSGEIFLDTFEPNNGAGWANGMSVSNFSGTDKKTLDSMQSGTYATQPVLSPDGKYLAFSGYDGSMGEGTLLKDGLRQAVLSPNTVEMLDTDAKQRIKLSNLPNNNRYPEVGWDPVSGNIIYSLVSKNIVDNGLYLYDISTSFFEKMRNTTEKQEMYAVISTLGNNKLLAGLQDNSISSLGNLGERYAPSFSKISVYDSSQNKWTLLPINRGLLQYVAILPSGYFGDVKNLSMLSDNGKNSESNNQLQLQRLEIKPSLGPERIKRQSARPGRVFECNIIATRQCNAMLGTNFEIWLRGVTSDEKFNACYVQQVKVGKQEAGCVGSPLYLYGKEGMRVKIKIGTEIFSSTPDYKDGFSVVLEKDGGIISTKQRYTSLSFDYTPAIKRLPALSYGKSVESKNLSLVIEEFGRKLGLNHKEIEDLTASLEGKISSPYVFVSFYDEKTSKAILPISFDPRPDVYRNIVFYLKPVDSPVPAGIAQFPKIPGREGFTAIEISYIIDN